MKKYLMLLMLCVSFSFAALASNPVSKGKVKAKVERKVVGKVEQKKDWVICTSFSFSQSYCPDGSSYVSGIDFNFVNCETQQPYFGWNVAEFSLEEGC
jgi:hypothetical protein